MHMRSGVEHNDVKCVFGREIREIRFATYVDTGELKFMQMKVNYDQLSECFVM